MSRKSSGGGGSIRSQRVDRGSEAGEKLTGRMAVGGPPESLWHWRCQGDNYRALDGRMLSIELCGPRPVWGTLREERETARAEGVRGGGGDRW